MSCRALKGCGASAAVHNGMRMVRVKLQGSLLTVTGAGGEILTACLVPTDQMKYVVAVYLALWGVHARDCKSYSELAADADNPVYDFIFEQVRACLLNVGA